MKTTKSVGAGKFEVYDLFMSLLIVASLSFYDIKPFFLGTQAIAFMMTFMQYVKYGKIKFGILTKCISWVAIFCLYSFGSFFWAKEVNITVISSSFSVLQVGLITICIISYGKTNERLKKLLFSFVLAAVLLCIRFLITIPISSWGQSQRFSQNTIFGSNNPALVLSYASLILMWMFLKRKKSVTSVVLLTLVAVFMFISMMTGTKKGILIFAIGVTVFVIGKQKKPYKLVGSLFLIAFMVFVGYRLITEIPILYGSIGYRVEQMIAGLSGGDGDGSTEMRMLFSQDAFRVFLENPILGIGQDGYRYLNPYEFTYSHNNYAELLCNLGLVGCSIFYSFYVLLLKKSFMLRETTLFPLGIILTIIIVDVAIVSYSHEVIYVLIGIVAAVLFQDEKTDQCIV